MACDRYYELLSARVDRELTRDEAEEVELHLAGCAQCRIVWEQMEETREAFAHLEEVPAPEGFAQGVMDRIRAEASPKVIPLFKRPQFRALAGLAACLALVVGLYGAARPHHLDRTVTRSYGGDAAEGLNGVSACEALPAPEDTPQIAAYAAPEDGAPAQKAAPNPSADGLGEEWCRMEATTTLERMPEGAAELIPPETAVMPVDGQGGRVYLDLPLEVLEQIERLAQEQGIGVTAERCSAPGAEVVYNLEILQPNP